MQPPATSLNMEQAVCNALTSPEFWDGLENRRPVYLPGAAAGLPEIISVDEVVEAFTLGSSSGNASAHKQGEPYMRDNYFLAYLDNAMLSLKDAEHFFPQFLALCRALAPTFDFVRARLVLEPPDCEGSHVVADNDLIAVQLWGERRLSLHVQPSGLAVTAPRPEALLKPTLRPGDALFVPKGVECRAASKPPGAPSISEEPTVVGPVLYAILTIGTSEQSFDVSVGQYLTDVLVAGPFSKEADAFFRSAVIKHTVPERYCKDGAVLPDREAARAELEAQLLRCAGELAAQLTATGLRGHYRKRMQQLRSEQLGAAGKVRATGRLPPDGITTRRVVRISRGVKLQCSIGAKVAHFKRGSDTLSLPIAETASALFNALSDGQSHEVGSLPCEDPFEKICVCQVLLFKGCLEVAGVAPGPRR